MKIEAYSFGSIIIDGKKYSTDILIVGDKIINWWRDQGHYLQSQDLKEVWDYEPDVLVVGQGAYGTMDVSEDVEKKCAQMGVEFISGKTADITDKYNDISDDKKVACGLHLTC
ncbi:MAG: MTH938/NDUFAF3 family protein [Elusimicrobiota bacterium]